MYVHVVENIEDMEIENEYYTDTDIRLQYFLIIMVNQCMGTSVLLL